MIACYFNFITGVMLGFELAEDDGSSFLIIDLLVVQIMLEWENK